MDILLVAATKLEIQPTIHFLERRAPRSPGSQGASAEILITGIGSVATTHSLTRRMGIKKPDLIIQAGIAGAFPGRKGGDLVVIREEILADLGVWEDGMFKTLFDMRLAGPDDPPFSKGRLVNPYEEWLERSALEPVRSLSVSEITTLPDRIGWYQQNWSPVVESMEGGAFHYTCLLEQVPFLQVRAISNAVGERDKARWEIGIAIRHLNEKLRSLLESLA